MKGFNQWRIIPVKTVKTADFGKSEGQQGEQPRLKQP